MFVAHFCLNYYYYYLCNALNKTKVITLQIVDYSIEVLGDSMQSKLRAYTGPV